MNFVLILAIENHLFKYGNYFSDSELDEYLIKLEEEFSISAKKLKEDTLIKFKIHQDLPEITLKILALDDWEPLYSIMLFKKGFLGRDKLMAVFRNRDKAKAIDQAVEAAELSEEIESSLRGTTSYTVLEKGYIISTLSFVKDNQKLELEFSHSDIYSTLMDIKNKVDLDLL